MPVKLYAWTSQHFYLYTAQMCAAAAGVEVETVIKTQEEMKEDKEMQKKKGNWKFPLLETEDGQFLGESAAIGAYLLRKGGKHDMCGKNAFESAQIDQWNFYINTAIDPIWQTVILNILGWKNDKDAWTKAISDLGVHLRRIEDALAKNGNLVSSEASLADMMMFRVAFPLFTFVLGPDQRAQLPAFTAWFEKMSTCPMVTAIVGKYQMCPEPWNLFDSGVFVKVPCAGGSIEEKKAEADDDEMDLFGSDDDDDQDARMALAAKAHEAKMGKKDKKVIIAKSLVLWEVKPLDSETDLDALAERILKMVVDGLQWKEQYKKEPVAFGIFKLIIGATIEDDKVSTDDIQEKFEAMDDMVQSVDILSFNKV